MIREPHSGENSSTQRLIRSTGTVFKRYRLVGAMGLAADLVPCVATDDHPVVVDSDLAGIEADGRPLETTDLAAPNAGRQFEQTFSRLTVEGSSSQILEGIAEQARGGRIIELLIMWRWANYMKVSEMQGFPSTLSEFIDRNFPLGPTNA